MKTVKKSVLFLTFALFLYCFVNPVNNASASDDSQPPQITLTEEEKAFIKEHPIIHLGVDPSFVPYEFFDTDGTYKGIAADYIDLICKKTGLQMVVEKGLTWQEAFDKAANKKLDALPCVSITQARQAYFLFSNAYYTFQRAVFVTKDNTSIKSIEDLKGKTAAVQTNSSHQGFLTSRYPAIKQSEYSSVEEALKAVSDGKETAFVGSLATSSYLVKSLGITNLKYIPCDTGDNQTLSFAVRNDWPVLVGIINKALGSITREEKIAIDNKWLGIQAAPDYSEVIKITELAGGIIFLILLVSVFWIIRLKREVTIRKRAQEELHLAKEEAERANEVKSMFLARMSHEVRTPLHAIMGMSYLFKKTEMTKTQGIYLDKMIQAARNMLGIINDILDFSKIEAGKISIEKTPFDLDSVLQRVLNIESVRVEEQGIELAMNKKPDMPRFFIGDPARVEQILLNIVTNAVKFTKKGGVALFVSVYAASGTLATIEFTVSDTGIGMSDEQLKHLFIPFNQADSSINRRFGGTGLGMSIIKNLVELMGGTLDVRSTLGAGSTFTVRLPLEVDEGSEKTELQNRSAKCFTSLRTLVLDKNEGSTNLLENCLQSFGISSDRAFSEYDALILTHRANEEGRPYHLMIVDYQTPEDNGIAFINRYKKQLYDGPVSKFILLIPFAREDLFEELEAAGIEFGITKPVIPSVLYNCIVDMFYLEPLEKNEAPVSRGGSMASYPYHILLVEDNITNQYIAQSILEQAGFVVSKADDGRDGYRYFKDHREEIHLILMDIHMPDIDGYTASDLIREIAPDVPIVAMTADAISGVDEKCKSHGMDFYVSKPFDPEELIQTILRILKARPTAPERASEKNPGNHEAVLDRADGLRRIGGDDQIYSMILREYHNENQHVLRLLKEKVEQKDYTAAAEIVHKTKSSSGNIGAKKLYAAASDLQNALSAHDEADILKKLVIFSLQLEQLLSEILAETAPEECAISNLA